MTGNISRPMDIRRQADNAIAYIENASYPLWMKEQRANSFCSLCDEIIKGKQIQRQPKNLCTCQCAMYDNENTEISDIAKNEKERVLAALNCARSHP